MSLPEEYNSSSLAEEDTHDDVQGEEPFKHEEESANTSNTFTEHEEEQGYFCPFIHEECIGKRFPAAILVAHIFSLHHDEDYHGTVCCPICVQTNEDDSALIEDIFSHMEDIHPSLFIDDTPLDDSEKPKITITTEESDSEKSPPPRKEIVIEKVLIEEEDSRPIASSSRKAFNNQCILLTAKGTVTNYKRPRNFEDEGSYNSDESEQSRDERAPQTKEEKLWEYFLQVDYSQSAYSETLHCSSCFKQISHIQLVDIFPCGHVFHGSKCNDSGFYCSLCKPNKMKRANTKTNFVIEEPKAKKTSNQIRRTQTFTS
eukprot:TRINITY_DN6186_c0_g1_i2.p1 TRINITY_DN6186_c0_g1~~TRINITY_DN6186_c0_g1_i2.p1  ORF type:complete len:315 (-),score=66.04 TRINITY_DN6186_c0_g1_i2:178-1122(-)